MPGYSVDGQGSSVAADFWSLLLDSLSRSSIAELNSFSQSSSELDEPQATPRRATRAMVKGARCNFMLWSPREHSNPCGCVKSSIFFVMYGEPQHAATVDVSVTVGVSIGKGAVGTHSAVLLFFWPAIGG